MKLNRTVHQVSTDDALRERRSCDQQNAIVGTRTTPKRARADVTAASTLRQDVVSLRVLVGSRANAFYLVSCRCFQFVVVRGGAVPRAFTSWSRLAAGARATTKSWLSSAMEARAQAKNERPAGATTTNL